MHTRNELHQHADSCGRCQATIFLAEHRAHHDHIRLRRCRLLPCAPPPARQATARSQHGRKQRDTHAPHQHAAPAQPAPAPHAGAGHRTRDDATPIVSTSADGYTTPKLDSRPGLDCCVIGCDVNVDAVWYYHRDHNKDRRRVYSTCMGKWLDLRRNFGVQYFAYRTGHSNRRWPPHAQRRHANRQHFCGRLHDAQARQPTRARLLCGWVRRQRGRAMVRPWRPHQGPPPRLLDMRTHMARSATQFW